VSVRGILQDAQTASTGDVHEFMHAAGHAEQVHDHHGPRSVRDASLDVLGVEPEALLLGLGEDGYAPAVQDRRHRGPVGRRRDDDLVPGFNLERV
jgi:hypothetical protein